MSFSFTPTSLNTKYSPVFGTHLSYRTILLAHLIYTYLYLRRIRIQYISHWYFVILLLKKDGITSIKASRLFCSIYSISTVYFPYLTTGHNRYYFL
jgi:hypothetical protein